MVQFYVQLYQNDVLPPLDTTHLSLLSQCLDTVLAQAGEFNLLALGKKVMEAVLQGQLEDVYLDMVHSILSQLKRDGHFQENTSLTNLFLQETVVTIL